MKTEILVQALYYLAAKNKGVMNKLTALKLIFFADRYHLRKYARTITRDNYFAMVHGPVSSTVYNILKVVLQKRTKKCDEIIHSYLKPTDDCYYFGITRLGKNIDCLSETDIESLDFAFNTFFSENVWEIVGLTHKYPEWKKFKEIFDQQTSIKSVPMWLEDFFEDSGLPDDPYNEIPANVVQLSKEYIFDQA